MTDVSIQNVPSCCCSVAQVIEDLTHQLKNRRPELMPTAVPVQRSDGQQRRQGSNLGKTAVSLGSALSFHVLP